MSNRRICGYLRVSTQDQSKGLESQARALRNFFQQKEITNYEFFSDEGISGAKSSRPSLDRLMKAVEDGEIETVVVYSFSRMARSVTHLLKVLELFDKYDVSFISLTEQLDTKTPSGRAIFTILGAISQLERELIAERVRNGLANARAKGIHIGRKKTRNSELIRALLKKKLRYREIAELADCSHGSINAERKAMLKEQEELKKKQNLERLEAEQPKPEEETAPTPEADRPAGHSEPVVHFVDFKNKTPDDDGSFPDDLA